MPAPAPDDRSPRPWFWILASVFLAAGTCARLGRFLDARSLWLDEAMLALNIASRSFADLLRPLDYLQVAPPLFLWLERLAVVVFGTSETALRAWPMVAGIAALPLVAFVAHRLLGAAGALAALALASLSPTLIRYADEAKPYGSDALVTVVLLAATLAVRDRPAAVGRWIALIGAGIVALLLSIPAALVLPAALTALLIEPEIGRHRRAWLAGCALAWAAALAVVYAGVYRPVANNPYQQQGYEGAFLVPGEGLEGRALLALRGTVWPTFAGNGSHVPNRPKPELWLVVTLLIAGLAFVVRRNGIGAGLLLVQPLLLAVVASSLRRYPLGVPRMMVFAAPLLVLMAAGAASGMASLLRRRVRPGFLAAAGLLCLAPMAQARLAEAKTRSEGDVRTLVALFRERPIRDEPVYVGARGIPTWLFYSTNWEKPDRERLAFYARAASTGPAFENLPSRGRPVVNEGHDLVYRSRRGTELLGIGTGRQWRWPSWVKGTLDEGWAANEAARIARAAEPCAWMYFAHLSERANKPVTWHLRDHHRGTRVTLESAPGAVLYRYCFPYRPEALERLRRWKAGLPGAESAHRTEPAPAVSGSGGR